MMVLIMCNPPKRYGEAKWILNVNNEGTVRMAQEVIRPSYLGNHKVSIMQDFT